MRRSFFVPTVFEQDNGGEKFDHSTSVLGQSNSDGKI